jgi:hypothetical protein
MYTDWNFTISPEAQKVFNEALKGFVGANYTPLAFASQIVAGINYCFLCKAKGAYPNAPEKAVKLYIFEPLPMPGAHPHITEIVDVKP